MKIHDPSSFHVGDKIAMTDIFLYLWKKRIDDAFWLINGDVPVLL
jgi:hypothetical protein